MREGIRIHASRKTFVTSARPDRVWQVIADVEHWRNWTPTVVEIKPLSNTGLSVGARYQVSQPKLRRAVYEVTKCTCCFEGQVTGTSFEYGGGQHSFLAFD